MSQGNRPTLLLNNTVQNQKRASFQESGSVLDPKPQTQSKVHCIFPQNPKP